MLIVYPEVLRAESNFKEKTKRVEMKVNLACGLLEFVFLQNNGFKACHKIFKMEVLHQVIGTKPTLNAFVASHPHRFQTTKLRVKSSEGQFFSLCAQTR